MAKAKEWYKSADYQKILPQRTTHLVSDLILVDGVGAGLHDRLLRAAAQGENRCVRGSVGSRALSWLGDTVVPDKRPIRSCCRSPSGYGRGPPSPTTTR